MEGSEGERKRERVTERKRERERERERGRERQDNKKHSFNAEVLSLNLHAVI